MNKTHILFDLDGTLTDPGMGITNSVAHALAHFGITVTDRTQLYRFIGPPLMDSFMEYYGLTEEQALSTIRLSFCPETTPVEFRRTADALSRCVTQLRSLTK